MAILFLWPTTWSLATSRETVHCWEWKAQAITTCRIHATEADASAMADFWLTLAATIRQGK